MKRKVAHRFGIRKAFSTIEMVVVIVVFSLVGLFVAYLTIEVARLSTTSISVIPAELNAYRLMDRTRVELMPAEVRSAQITDAGRTINYRNPALGHDNVLWFDEGQCFLRIDIGGEDDRTIALASDIEDVVFRFPNEPNRRSLEISVSTTAFVSTVTRERDRTNTYTDVIKLRN